MSYIRFEMNPQDARKKTLTWTVYTLDEWLQLGQVKWYAPWRKYCFFPASVTVWEEKCLNEISDFIFTHTEAHKRARHTLAVA